MARPSSNSRWFYEGTDVSHDFKNLDYDFIWDFLRRSGSTMGSFFGQNAYSLSDEQLRYLLYLDELYGSISDLKGTPEYGLITNYGLLQFQPGLDEASWRDRQNNIAEYIAKIRGTRVQNQYNSTAAQSLRDKVAGFNDALTGQLAGGSQAADTAPDEVPTQTGVSPDAQLAADVQERQNSFGRAMSIISMPLQFLQTLGQTFDMFTRLKTVGPEIQKIFSDIGLQSEQTEDLKNKNKASWKSQFADVLLGGLDLASGVVNIGDRLSSVDKSTWSKEQSAYFDELNNSGYFADKNGNASASMLQDYSNRFADTAHNMAAGSQDAGVVGGLSNLGNPVLAAGYFYEKYTSYQLRLMRLTETGRDLDNKLKIANESLALAQAALARQQEATSAQQEDLLVSETQKAQNEAEIARLQLAVEQAGQRAKILEQQKREHEAHVEKVKAEGKNALYDYLETAPPTVRAAGISAMSFIDGVADGMRQFQNDNPFTGLLGKLIPSGK